MKATAVKTDKIVPFKQNSIFEVLDKFLPAIKGKSVIAVTSKIVAITEGRMVKIGTIDKQELIRLESQYFIPLSKNKYEVSITVKDNFLVASAGVDESNGDGYYVLWPKDAQKSANLIREYLVKKFSIKDVGVVITDSVTTPLRWGVRGFAIAHSGFAALNDYIGHKDIFSRELQHTKVNVMDGLAGAAALVMGEGNEQTPMAVLMDLPFVHFQRRNPTDEELRSLRIEMEDDLYWPLLQKAPFEKSN